MKKVLIVDDEPVVLDVLQRILYHLGYNAVVVDTGEGAMEKFTEQNFDIVMLDVLMPNKNGFEIAQEMKQLRRDQKIVMVTGLGPFVSKYIPETDNAEIDEILPKPFTYENVKHVVEDVKGDVRELHESELTTTLW
jgi:YesN/AraC family two-component response regulator